MIKVKQVLKTNHNGHFSEVLTVKNTL